MRQTLEKELPEDRDIWDEAAEARRTKNVWDAVKVLTSDLRRRDLITPAVLETMKRMLSPEGLKKSLAGNDKPDTRTAFTLVMEANWDDEHQLKAEFRNGKFEMIDHE